MEGGTKPESHSGPEANVEREAAAEKILAGAMAALDLDGQKPATLPKGAPEKRAIARILKARTTQNNLWIAKKVKCGHPAGIPRMVQPHPNRANQKKAKQAERIITKLLQ